MRTFVLLPAVIVFSITAVAAQTPTPAQIEAGKKVYATNKCQTCHSIEGVGSKLSPLDGVGSKLSAADIRTWLTNPEVMTAKLKTKPKVPMKKYSLPDADLDA